ncbi:ABC-type Fe3+-hydroxamate transport system substrate-binding protein [Halarchaeum solikamskense]|uniref:ABC transporter substrate-binding protein n=1 Tax=Halarchaeum nitratireducens TaxID=489913 RepID=UPI001B3A7C64|nr:ABC transporter substrate-binding protein [Halarchaeum solikamskense]MBP2251088.1 ABC-type Fe3+-hydroxamate transport system substrate-binding protein [Halarchaeum solikamskense]
MTDDDANTTAAPTRRDYLKYGGAVVGGGLLAGCAGQSESGETPTERDENETDTSTQADESYSVTMAPAGTVKIEEPPTSVMVYNLLYADMAVAYGYGDAVNSLGFSTDVGGALDAFYAHLDGVSFDYESLTQLNTGSGNLTVDMELFYELDSDLHLVDPALIASFDGWTVDDVEEITENIAPFFGNNYSRRNTEPPKPYRDDYEYYTLWEISEKVAKVFRAQQRYQALASIHDDLLATIRSNLPPEGERPTVGSVIYMGETFYPAKINTPGFANAHTRPLGATDAFAGGDISYESSYDFETMVEIDPDVILHRYGYSYYDVESLRKELSNHAVGQQLSAIRNGCVYAGGNPLQGPVMNLFQLEMTAKQLYPDIFGDWPTYTGGSYPEIAESEQLFDRQRVANVINGGI